MSEEQASQQEGRGATAEPDESAITSTKLNGAGLESMEEISSILEGEPDKSTISASSTISVPENKKNPKEKREKVTGNKARISFESALLRHLSHFEIEEQENITNSLSTREQPLFIEFIEALRDGTKTLEAKKYKNKISQGLANLLLEKTESESIQFLLLDLRSSPRFIEDLFQHSKSNIFFSSVINYYFGNRHKQYSSLHYAISTNLPEDIILEIKDLETYRRFLYSVIECGRIDIIKSLKQSTTKWKEIIREGNQESLIKSFRFVKDETPHSFLEKLVAVGVYDFLSSTLFEILFNLETFDFLKCLENIERISETSEMSALKSEMLRAMDSRIEKTKKDLREIIYYLPAHSAFQTAAKSEAVAAEVRRLVENQNKLSSYFKDFSVKDQRQVILDLEKRLEEEGVKLSEATLAKQSLESKTNELLEEVSRLETQILELRRSVRAGDASARREVVVGLFKDFVSFLDTLPSASITSVEASLKKLGLEPIGHLNQVMPWDAEISESVTGNPIEQGNVIRQGYIFEDSQGRVLIRRVLLSPS